MKIVHLADLHLGYRAYNRLDKRGLNIREKDVANAFKESLDKVVEINPDIVLVAGDIFHKPRPSNATIYLTIKLLQNFRSKCSAPIIMISGNHEMFKSVEAGSILKVLETSIPDIKIIDDKTEQVVLENLDTSIFCMPYNSLNQFDKISISSDKSFKYNIFMTHGSFNSPKCPELSKHELGAIIEESHIKHKQWDYVAYGHYHKYVELAPNAFYSGAIERTSSNIWQESEDKGFIEYDLDTKQHKFHSLKTPRKMFDIKTLDAVSLTAEQIDEYISKEISQINNFDKSMVRMNIENIDAVAWSNIDYQKVRELKKKAVHFRTNFLRKETRKIDEDTPLAENKQNLIECIEDEINTFELSQGLDKNTFSEMAKKYLKDVENLTLGEVQ